MPLDQNSHQTVTCLGVSAFQCMCAFLCPKCDNFACLHSRQDQNELQVKRWFFAKIGIFCKSIAGPLSEAKTHWVVNWLHLLKQLNFVSRHTIQLLRTTVSGGTFCHSSNILGCMHCFWLFTLWFIDEDQTVLSLFSHTALTVLLFVQNPYAIFAHILQHYHDFQNNVTIFPSVVQAYTQPYSFGGRIKLIIYHIRHELSVTIHEITTSCLYIVPITTSLKQLYFGSFSI